MKKEFDKEAIQAMNLFEDVTDVEVVDCVQDDESIYFLVEPGKAGAAIGKDGKKIEEVGDMLNKRIKVFEYGEDEKEFVKNMIIESNEVDIEDGTAFVSVDRSDRGKVIGSGGNNINKVRTLVRRNSDLEDVKLK
ncbi:MAG: NusA-like transcription termination signal-binding factor [Candidatus Aenigmatarchaeota archaeon]